MQFVQQKMQKKPLHQRPRQEPIHPTTQEKSLSMQPAFIVKIYINPKMQTQINLNTNSDIDTVIYSCIDKYNLKKSAHPYLKKQIQFFMEKSICKTESDEVSTSIDNSIENKTPGKRQFILNDLKAGDIALNKITVQRTPKNAEKSFVKKQTSSFKTSKFIQGNPKIFLAKNKNEKQNQRELSFQFKSLADFKKEMALPEKNISQTTEKQSQKQKQIPLKQKKISQNKLMKNNLFHQNLEKDKKERKIKTETDLDMSAKMTEFSLLDLQNQMNQQVIQLKYEKKAKNVESELCELFHSIIRYNPPSISCIDLRYICYEDLSEQVYSNLRAFIISLNEEELNSLDFSNFKKLLIKHRFDALFQCLK